MAAAIIISFLLSGFPQLSVPHPPLSNQIVVEGNYVISAKPTASPTNLWEIIPPPFGEIIENSCSNVPSGLGIPGFQPGLNKNDVLNMLGVPSESSSGYWPNTNAVSYDLIPDEVSLGFLFDISSEQIRQTEASFTSRVDLKVILVTLNGMLGCKLNNKIEQGLEKVRQRQSRRYSFRMNSLKGVIERDKRDRIYIGIWQSDLH
ncbi:hypothetical protein [Microcoleus sp. FACHB-831]|jgi:hypothetical protein|uniref:hypothetical protein n=1 Tax=Microcoleus sp. FACHB-831 TaxID=2692827 RepID=UPI0018F059A5|nr:hypothetical protein [Microcoleus sp. FACHB-831]